MTRATGRRSKLVRRAAPAPSAPPQEQSVAPPASAAPAAPAVGGGSWLTLAGRLALPGILVLALVLRLVYLFTVEPPFIGPDSRTYDQLAKHLLYNQVFSYSGLRYGATQSMNVTEIADPEPTTYYLPGYPLFLASIYALVRPYPQSPFRLVRFGQVLLAVGAVYLVYLLGRWLGGESVGLVAAAIAALYPPFITSAANIMTEPLTLPALLLATYLTLQALGEGVLSPTKSVISDQLTFRRILWAGVAWGAVAMIRISFLPIPVFLGGALLVSRTLSNRALARFLGIFTAGILILVGPWVLRNLVAFGRLELTSGAGPVLNAASHYRFADWILERQERQGDPDAPADEAQGGLVGIERGLFNLGESLSENPLRFWHWLLVQKFSTLWGYWHLGEYSPNFSWLPGRWWVILHRWVVWPGLIGLLLALSRGPTSWVLLAPLALVTVVHQVTLGAPRYALPVIPLLVVGTGWLLVELSRRAAQVVGTRKWLWALLAGVVVVIVLIRPALAALEERLASSTPMLWALLQAVIQLATLATLAAGLAQRPRGGTLGFLIAALADAGPLPDSQPLIPRLLLVPLALWALADVNRLVNWRRHQALLTGAAALLLVFALVAWRTTANGPWLYPWVSAFAPPWGNLLFFGLPLLMVAAGLAMATRFRPAGGALAALALTLSSFGLAAGGGLVPQQNTNDTTLRPGATLSRELELPEWAHGYPRYALTLCLASQSPGAGSALQVLINGMAVAEATVRYRNCYPIPLDPAVIGDKEQVTVDLVASAGPGLEMTMVPGSYGVTRLSSQRQPSLSQSTPLVGLAMQGRGMLRDVNLWLGEAIRQ